MYHPPNTNPTMYFTKRNYLLALASVATVALGFLLMSGGGSANPEEFNPEIFSFRRITLAPLVVMVGYLIMVVAIMKTDRNAEKEAQ